MNIIFEIYFHYVEVYIIVSTGRYLAEVNPNIKDFIGKRRCWPQRN